MSLRARAYGTLLVAIGIGGSAGVATPGVGAARTGVGAAAPGAGTERLSAAADTGPVVVRNEGDGTWTAQSAWRLARVERIGDVEGDGPAVFGRIDDARLGPDGNVYVLDSQAPAVKVFTPEGTFVRAIGRSGRGPGELTDPYSLAFDGQGRLWVADAGTGRYTVFTLGGELVRTVPSLLNGRPLVGQLTISNDTLCDIGRMVETVRNGASISMRGVGFVAVRFVVGEKLDVVDTTHLTETRAKGLKRVRGGTTMTVLPGNYVHDVRTLGPDGSLWTGTTDRYAVHHVLPGHDTTRIVTRAVEPTPFDKKDAEGMRAWVRKMRDRGFEGDVSELPRAYPLFARFLVTGDGYLWVLRRLTNTANGFDVFDTTGVFLGTVPTVLSTGSASVQPHERDGHLVGVVADSLGVQYVEVDRIVKTGGGM